MAFVGKLLDKSVGAITKVGQGVSDGVKTVGHGVKTGVKTVGKGAKNVVTGAAFKSNPDRTNSADSDLENTAGGFRNKNYMRSNSPNGT